MGHSFSYLTSRRYVDLYIGLALLLLAAVFTLTGQTLERYGGFVSRNEQPKRFWEDIVTCLILGVFFLGLSLIAFYLYRNPN